MIQPADIEAKAIRIYEAFVRAWLDDEANFFPRAIPSEKRVDPDMPTAIREIAALKNASKEVLGFGYSVEWREINSRIHGRNYFPDRISFETEEDLLRFTGKQKEFRCLRDAVSELISALPELSSWARANPRVILDIAGELGGLVEVTKYLKCNPRPGCFARELPLQVDTKFVERYERVLRQWLDLVLPPEAIRADEDHFERRYGLNYVEPPILVRVLDPLLQQRLSFPCPVVWLPLHSLIICERAEVRVLAVENRVNLMTLPPLKDTLALGGLGNSVNLLRYVPWLRNVPFAYWGDIDVEGFEILSRLRAQFPNLESVLMDDDAVERFSHLAGTGNLRKKVAPPPHLTSDEAAAFTFCVEKNFRLEQERVPNEYCVTYFSSRFTVL